MANLRHPTWRMESSPSSSRGADAGVADVSLGGPSPSVERGLADWGYCACSRQGPRLVSRSENSAAPRFAPCLGRSCRELWNADRRIGSLPQFCSLTARAWTHVVCSDGAALGRRVQSWYPSPALNSETGAAVSLRLVSVYQCASLWSPPACLSGCSASLSGMLSLGGTRVEGVRADRTNLEPP